MFASFRDTEIVVLEGNGVQAEFPQGNAGIHDGLCHGGGVVQLLINAEGAVGFLCDLFQP